VGGEIVQVQKDHGYGWQPMGVASPAT
jgi:hypothetical protein